MACSLRLLRRDSRSDPLLGVLRAARGHVLICVNDFTSHPLSKHGCLMLTIYVYRSRAEYIQQLISDIASYYGYNDFLAEKLFQLFPVAEVCTSLSCFTTPWAPRHCGVSICANGCTGRHLGCIRIRICGNKGQDTVVTSLAMHPWMPVRRWSLMWSAVRLEYLSLNSSCEILY